MKHISKHPVQTVFSSAPTPLWCSSRLQHGFAADILLVLRSYSVTATLHLGLGYARKIMRKNSHQLSRPGTPESTIGLVNIACRQIPTHETKGRRYLVPPAMSCRLTTKSKCTVLQHRCRHHVKCNVAR